MACSADHIVKIPDFFKRLAPGARTPNGRAGGAHGVVIWLFIALVALFLTHPGGAPTSVFGAPIPLPPELGLEAAPAP